MTANPALTRTVLYFTAGRTPTAEDYAAEAKILGRVSFIAPDTEGLVNGPTISADAVATAPGVSVPTAYNTLPVVTPPRGDVPFAFGMALATLSVESDKGPVTAAAVGIEFTDQGKPEIKLLNARTECTFTSSATEVATVDASGVITLVGPGTATITPKYDTGLKDAENAAILVNGTPLALTVTGGE